MYCNFAHFKHLCAKTSGMQHTFIIQILTMISMFQFLRLSLFKLWRQTGKTSQILSAVTSRKLKRKPKKTHISLPLSLDVCMHGYKLTHITFTPVTVTPSSTPHSMVQGINKETPFPAATNTESSIAMHPSVFKVLPYHSLLAVNHLPIGYKAVLVALPYLQLQGRVFLCLFP